MFGNTGNNNNNDRSTNTKIKTFFGDLSCLQLAYWNENLSIKINPLQGVSADGIRQYDYTRRANTALTPDKCIALKEKIDEKILSKMKEVKEKGTLDAPVNTGVSVGNKGIAVFIEYKNDENEKPYVYLTIYTNIGQDNKAPKDGVYSYKFAKVNAVDDYDPESGTGTDSYVDAEFLFFYDKLKNIADICGTAAHSVNVDNSFKSTAPRNNGGNYSSYNNQNSQASNNNYSAPVSSFNDEEFPFN